MFGGYARYLARVLRAVHQGGDRRDDAPGPVRRHLRVDHPEPRVAAGIQADDPGVLARRRLRDLDERYFRLVNRARQLDGVIDWSRFGEYSPFDTFLDIFRAENVGEESYFDRMTHFDFKTLLPALLQVEDRVSMAHGLESRTPFVDHEVVEFAATLPAIVKFKGGELKHVVEAGAGRRPAFGGAQSARTRWASRRP